jgi:hypothetical protein
MRVYALYFRNKLVLTVVTLEALATMGIGLVSTFHLYDQDAHSQLSTPTVGSL